HSASDPGTTGSPAIYDMIIDDTGHVGIGTFPEQRLSVDAAVNIDQGNQNNGTTDFALSFGHASGEAVGSKRTAGGNQFGLDFYTKFANRMSITQNGNVGIGTFPDQRLSVDAAVNIDQGNQNNGTTDFALSFGHASGEAIGSKRTAGGNQFGMDFYTKFANRMSITQNGDVGIGTTSPSARLQVSDGTGANANGAHVQIGG